MTKAEKLLMDAGWEEYKLNGKSFKEIAIEAINNANKTSLDELPDWTEAQLYSQMDDEEKNYSPLHQFIYDYEPADKEGADKFRADLLELINHYLA